MDTQPITSSRLAASVIAVPPLARDTNLKIDRQQNERLVRFLEQGGITTLLYGGNAVLYHVKLTEYANLLGTICDIASSNTLMIPSVGPAFGTMMDQADVLADFDFPTVMLLPQKEVCDSAGLATGIRMFAETFGKPIVVYLKHDRWLAPDTVGKMYRDGIVSWIKYAVVRDNPAVDDYLREVLQHVPADIVVSGIGEQPAIIHLRDFSVITFTSGCVCVAPSRSMEMLRAIQQGQYDEAESLRAQCCGLEDPRNSIQPIRVLHRAVELAEIAKTGPMLPMLGELSADQLAKIKSAAKQLLAWQQAALVA